MRQRKYHFVLSFEDNGETFYVYKYYGIHKQWWHYVVWDQYELDFFKKTQHTSVRQMKKAIISCIVILFTFLLSVWIKVDPSLVLLTMIAYWVFLDRLEREDKK